MSKINETNIMQVAEMALRHRNLILEAANACHKEAAEMLGAEIVNTPLEMLGLLSGDKDYANRLFDRKMNEILMKEEQAKVDEVENEKVVGGGEVETNTESFEDSVNAVFGINTPIEHDFYLPQEESHLIQAIDDAEVKRIGRLQLAEASLYFYSSDSHLIIAEYAEGELVDSVVHELMDYDCISELLNEFATESMRIFMQEKAAQVAVQIEDEMVEVKPYERQTKESDDATEAMTIARDALAQLLNTKVA